MTRPIFLRIGRRPMSRDSALACELDNAVAHRTDGSLPKVRSVGSAATWLAIVVSFAGFAVLMTLARFK